MAESEKVVTDKTLKAWLKMGAVDRGIGEGLTFVATEAGSKAGRASWILRYRFGGKHKEKVLGRYPDIALKEAREIARRDRGLIQQGVDVSAEKRKKKLEVLDRYNVEGLGHLWIEREIQPKYQHPQVVERVLRRHIYPVIGRLPVDEIQPAHVDDVLTRIVAAGAPTVANDALRYLTRMFHFAVKRKWIVSNPASEFEQSDAGGTEHPRTRALNRQELATLSKAMRDTPTFGRVNELAVWLLLAFCVRKMELLAAKWTEFDLAKGVWTLQKHRTKTSVTIAVPLAPPVITWLNELKVHAAGSEYLFPARRILKKRFEHISPDTLNAALKRLHLENTPHFTVHDMRRTARSLLAELGVSRFVAERALNHKLRGVEGIYDQFDYFEQRKEALTHWANLLDSISRGEPFNVVPLQRPAA